MSLGVTMAGVACCPFRRGASISVNSLVLILKDLFLVLHIIRFITASPQRECVQPIRIDCLSLLAM